MYVEKIMFAKELCKNNSNDLKKKLLEDKLFRISICIEDDELRGNL